MRLWALGAATPLMLAVASGFAGCTSESSRATTTPDPCAVGDCSGGDGGTTVSDASADASAPRDAALLDTGPSGAVTDWDGARPPIEDGSTGVPVRDAAWEDGGVIGPGGPVLPGDPPNRAICSNAGPLGFSTQFLTATSLARGTAVTDPLTTPWANAAQRTGAPGPALLVLDNLGLLPAGGVRAVRVGAPRTTAGASPFGFLQTANNPLATNWLLTNMYGVAADTTASPTPAGTLRLKASSGATVDIPFVAAKLDGRFSIDQTTEACTSLQVSSLDFFVPESAGSTLFEGQNLSSLLGAATFTLGAASTTYWRITLRGAAPVVSLQASP
jgi:hypothetical protein